MFRRNSALNSGAEKPSVIKLHPDHLVCDTKWLLNDIQRRIYISSEIPKTHFAKAGTVTSGYLATNLEDELAGDGNSFSVLLEKVKSRVLEELNSTLQNFGLKRNMV